MNIWVQENELLEVVRQARAEERERWLKRLEECECDVCVGVGARGETCHAAIVAAEVRAAILICCREDVFKLIAEVRSLRRLLAKRVGPLRPGALRSHELHVLLGL